MLQRFYMKRNDHKVGEYIKDIHYNDIWEIIDISGTQPLDYVKLAKKFDNMSFKPVSYTHNILCNYRDLKSQYVRLPMARLLLQSNIRR